MPKNGFIRATKLSVDIWRGRVLGARAAAHGIWMRDDQGNEVLAAEALFRGASVSEDPDDDHIAIIELDVGVKSLLNNTGSDVRKGQVVVTDPTEDEAFCFAAAAGVSDREVGVVEAAIADGESGPVRFSGYMSAIETADAVVRGEFFKTSATPGLAETTTDREEGSFAVALTGADPADVTSSDWRVWRESWDGGALGGTPASWETVAFDDDGWFAPHDLGAAAIGGHEITPEEAFAGTTLKTLHWLARSPIFTLDALPAAPKLELAHDDGIAVYLNGVLVHSNAALATETVVLAPSDFVIGDNVLAIRLTNTATSNVWAVNPTSLGLRAHDGAEDLCVIGQPFLVTPVPSGLLFGVPDLIDPATFGVGVFETTTEGGGSVIAAHGNAGATETIDPTDGNVHTLTLNANCTITLNPPTVTARACVIEVQATQDGTGGWTITWPVAVAWAGGVPSPSTSPGAIAKYILETLDGGTSWIGALAGGSTAPSSADYLVGTAQAGLSAEIVVGATPGGELGGTWPSPTVDTTHSGSSHAATQAAAEATAAASLAAALAAINALDHEHINDIQFNGDGSTTAFELPAAPFDAFSVAAYVAGVRLDVTLSGTMLTTMTFGSAPASGTGNIMVDLIAAAA